MKVLVIPDVHLKDWMFSQAIDIMETTDCENAVILGDLVEDWGFAGLTPLIRPGDISISAKI